MVDTHPPIVLQRTSSTSVDGGSKITLGLQMLLGLGGVERCHQVFLNMSPG